MPTKTTQLLLILSIIIVTIALFVFGKTKTPITEALKTNNLETETSVSDTDFNTYIVDELINLKLNQQDSIILLNEQLEAITDNNQKHQAYTKLSDYWLSLGQPDISAYYAYKGAQASGNTQHLIQASKRMQLAATHSPDSLPKAFFTEKAIRTFSNLSQSMPDSLHFAISHAELLINQNNQVMQGVMILRSVIEKDSVNLHANLLLGRLSVVSGQFDKAVKRMQTVLKQQPENTEALYFLGEAYVGLGETQMAVSIFKKCKQLVDNPTFKTEIDKYINKISKQ